MDLAHEVAGAKEWDWYRSLLRRASAVTGNVFELLLTVDILVLIDDAEFALEALERSIAVQTMKTIARCCRPCMRCGPVRSDRRKYSAVWIRLF